jgi:AhpD family alkylhydroperoxidase
MTKIQVYDPPMCCSTGICGPSPDPVLPRFVADLQWLAGQGVEVERFNLSQQPQAFVANAVVKAALTEHGNECLPLLLVDGVVVSRGTYPVRGALARLTRLQATDVSSLYTPAVAELVAIGAAIAANCEPCLQYHFDQARKLGVSKDDMARAVKTAQAVKDTPAQSIFDLANRLLQPKAAPLGLPVLQASCCAPDEASSSDSSGCGCTSDKASASGSSGCCV